MSQGRAVTSAAPGSSRGLAKYQLVAEIGRGGMADVFLAVRKNGAKIDEKVVIKQLRSDVAEDEDFRAMFMDEARLAVRLLHPNVVRTFEAGKDEHRCFIAMEFLDGQPLSRLRRRGWRQGGKLPLDVHLRILSDVLAGLHYVHEVADPDGMPLGIVHRDVTPPNVFISYDGEVKVVDFGIAKASSRLAETRIGVVKGKIAYMAPEHARGDQVDRRSDIFSVGVMLWEAVKGRRYWQGHEELTIYRRLLANDLPPVGGDEVGLPALSSILDRSLAVDAAKRYRTAAEMRAAIEDALRQMGSRVDGAAVGRCTRELFDRERVAFDTAVRAELLRLRAGKKRPVLAVLNDGTTSLLRESSASWQSAPTVGVVPAKPADDAMVDFRPKWSFWRTVAWLTIGIALGVAAWLGVRRGDDAKDLRPVAELRPPFTHAAAPRPSPPAQQVESEPEPKGDAIPSQLTPASVRGSGATPAPPHVRPAPAKAPVPNAAPEELKKTTRTRRSLDQDDPWAE
jgi:serine/threonine-protein kinase